MSLDPIADIFAAWQSGKSALLYGPPGTGKTRILSDLIQELDSESARPTSLALDASNPGNPFQGMLGGDDTGLRGLPGPVKKIWLTFHQSFSYEDFVIGLVPSSSGASIKLLPKAGVLLDAIAGMQGGDDAKSVVIFIDEINRGNAAKIFGEFLTFLDFDYRETSLDGTVNIRRIPLPLRHLSTSNGKYEGLLLQDGSEVTLDFPSYFPRHIYVVATMNSVDRTAIPIDSALARRFNRIEIRPDLELLMMEWGLTGAELSAKASDPTSLGPTECAALILDRVNLAIAENFGPDFELGHGLVMSLKSDSADGWAVLTRLWDETVFPQIEDRFSGRPEELSSLLRVEEFASLEYAWRYRTSLSGVSSSRVLAPVSLAGLEPLVAKRSLQLLASQQLLP